MNESRTNRIAALTFWVVVWFIGLVGLALASVPGVVGDDATPATPTYYSPAQTNTIYQSADGSHTVLVRPLRPVLSR